MPLNYFLWVLFLVAHITIRIHPLKYRSAQFRSKFYGVRMLISYWIWKYDWQPQFRIVWSDTSLLYCCSRNRKLMRVLLWKTNEYFVESKQLQRFNIIIINADIKFACLQFFPQIHQLPLASSCFVHLLSSLYPSEPVLVFYGHSQSLQHLMTCLQMP